MPDVAAEFGEAGTNLYGWAFTAFFLGTLIGIVAAGGLVARGLAAPFLGGLGLFAIGLLIGGLAPTMQVLVPARFIQGLGAGAIPPVAYVAIARSMPEELRPRMFAWLSTAWALPGVMGPAIAGIVGDTIGWRAVFLGLLPLVVIAAVTTTPALRAVAPPPEAVDAEAQAAASLRRRLPLAVLVAAGTALFTAAITTGEPLALVGLALPGLAVGVFALRRLTPPGTLRAAPGMPTAVLIRGLATFGFFAVDAYVSRVRRPARADAGAGGHRAHRDHHHLDGRLVDPGPLERALAAVPLRSWRPAHRGGGDRHLHARCQPGRPGVDRRADVRAGRPGHGPVLLAAEPDRAPRGDTRRTGLGVVGAVADRCPRHRPGPA